MEIKAAVSQQVIFNTLFVKWSDGTTTMYDAVEMGCKWFRMDNDTFYDIYGFNFNPHKYPGLYEKCRKIVFQNR